MDKWEYILYGNTTIYMSQNMPNYGCESLRAAEHEYFQFKFLLCNYTTQLQDEVNSDVTTNNFGYEMKTPIVFVL